MRLFSDRARLSQPTFALTSANAAPVVEICRRLDGIPLAIELAAARVKALPVEQIAARMGDFFRLLTGGSRTALPRQQTLRALIDWSYDLLSQTERIVLRRLSVFAGGWTLEAAEVVCAGEGIEGWDVLDLLAALVEKSLVVFEEEHEGEARYRLLETVRQYARERLLESGEAQDLRGRHLEFFLQLAVRAEPELHGPRQAVWLERLETEFDNIRTALEWSRAAEEQVGTGIRLLHALRMFLDVRSHRREVLPYLCEWLEECRDAPPRLRAGVLLQAALYTGLQGNRPASRSLREQSLAIYREVDDREGIAMALHEVASSIHGQGDLTEARSLWQESLDRFTELGDEQISPEGSYLRAWAVRGLGWIAWQEGDHSSGEALTRESLRLFRELGDQFGIAFALASLGRQARHLGDHSSAGLHYRECLPIFQQLRAKDGILESLQCLAGFSAVQGQMERAARLWGAAAVIREAIGLAPRPRDGRGEAAARAALGDEAFAAAREEGRRMTLEQALEYALKDAGSSFSPS